MPDNPNRLIQFWQELKRRKVVRVITVYAAAAFVILELLSIIIEPLRLPIWTLQFAIVFLCIGFIIAVILSWIYDIHPEGGIVKTESAQEVKEEGKPVSSNSWKIASYISFVVIVGLIVFHFISRNNLSEELTIIDKSIAVLPFVSLSDDPEKQYLADGVMDAILLHLSKIEDLRVMSRTSVEQYRVTEKKATEICQELDVAFLLEGSFQKYGDQAKLTVQLIIPGKEGHHWANDYDRDWRDIFSVQSEVAQLIAKELQAAITPEEQQLIEKIPTTNLTAYDFYQRGREEYLKYNWFIDNREVFERAEKLYNVALEYDSTFARAYAGLADVYLHKDQDSLLILADKALSYDNQLADAYTAKGRYYIRQGKVEQANEEFNNALQFNPNDYRAYEGKGDVAGAKLEYVKRLEYLHKAASLSRGSEFPTLLRRIGWEYFKVGFKEEGILYFQQAFKLDGDSVAYYTHLIASEINSGNFEKAIESGLKGYSIDSFNISILRNLGRSYLYFGQYEESIKYYEKIIAINKTLGKSFIRQPRNIGCAYWQNGNKEEAKYYFDEQKRYNERSIRLNDRSAINLNVYYDLAAINVFMGEKEKAYENLRMFNQRKVMNLILLTSIKNDPIFSSLRDEPEFQQIVSNLEAKYQAEHERIRKWLE